MLQTFYDLNGVEYHQDVVKLEKKEFSGKEVSLSLHRQRKLHVMVQFIIQELKLK